MGGGAPNPAAAASAVAAPPAPPLPPIPTVSARAAAAEATNAGSSHWKKMVTPAAAYAYYRLWGSGPNDIFAGGYNYGADSAILHYDGTNWMTMTLPTVATAIYGIWGSGPNDVFATSWDGGDGILHYDGSTWATMTLPIDGYNYGYVGVWGSSASDVFAVSYNDYLGGNQSVIHYDGSTWVTMTTPSAASLYAIWGSGSNDVFAVGYDYYGSGSNILHYDGSTWVTMTNPMSTTSYLYSVWGSGPNDVFAVGNAGIILHYNGTAWSLMTTKSEPFLYTVWGRGPNDVYTVGYSGNVYHYDGTSWTSELVASNAGLFGLWGSDAGGLYVSGSGGIWRHQDFTLDKQVTPKIATPGSTVTYTLDIANITQNKTITTVSLQDFMPVSVTVSGIVASGVAVTETGSEDNHVWEVQDLGPQMSGTITLTAIVSPELLAGTFTNTATLTGTEEGFVDYSDSAAALDICYNTVAVKNTDDAGVGANAPIGSLRKAIADVCVGGTINFDLTYPAVISLSAPLTVSKRFTLAGPGADQLAISGNQTKRVFAINSEGALAMDGLTIQDGKSTDCGAGISNQGALTLTHSVLTGNEDTGANGGGAICVKGITATLSLLNSSVYSNAAHFGGGISIINGASVTVANSSLFSNVVESKGGALYVLSGSANVVNSTIARNMADIGGGIYRQNAVARANFALVGQLHLANSIVAGNTATTAGPDIADVQPVARSQAVETQGPSGGYNLIGDDSDSNWITATGDITGVPALLAEPGLYGGSTFVLPLQLGSPAIDAGGAEACSAAPVNGLDQRDVSRTYGAGCDIGAFESRGYALSALDGDNQVVALSSAFTRPLSVSVYSLDGLSAEGMALNFAAPESGASATLTPTGPISVVNGAAAVWAQANEVAGSYGVTVSAEAISAPLVFHLAQWVPIDGLSASSSSPTFLGADTTFSASVLAGSNVSYTWDFGDGSSGAGQIVDHHYSDSGLFTATVTATNALGQASVSVLVNVATQGTLAGQLKTHLAADNLTYSFVVSNSIALGAQFRAQQSNPYLLTNVVLTGSVPANTTLVDWSGNVMTSTTGGSYGTGFVRLSVPVELAPGQSVTITWTVHPKSLSGDIQTDAFASSDTGVSQPTVSSDTYLWRLEFPLVFR